jgi:hypothetical protein
MSITVDPNLEARLRAKAEAEGLSVDAYLQSLLLSDKEPVEELEALALEGLNSGDPIEASPGYWEEKHRRLDALLKTITD